MSSFTSLASSSMMIPLRQAACMAKTIVTTMTSSMLVFVVLIVSTILLIKETFWGEPSVSPNSFSVLWKLLTSFQHFPDANRDSAEILRARGYSVEVHRCQTKDGYILTLHRVLPSSKRSFRVSNSNNSEGDEVPLRSPSPSSTAAKEEEEEKDNYQEEEGKERKSNQNKPVVLLHHGLMQSSAVYLMKEENSLPCMLVDAGFDVWLGNNRGTSYSSHSKYDKKDPEFWNYTWAEMGEFDLPAEFDHILQMTGQEKLIYIAHSQGTTQAFAGFSLNEGKLTEKVSLFIALSPAAFVKAEKSTLKLMSKLHQQPFILRFLLGHAELLPLLNPAKWFIKSFQAVLPIWAFMGLLFFEALLGWTDKNLDPHALPIVFWHTPDSTSTKSLQHYLQLINSEGFHAIDLGAQENIKRYGSSTPPHYDLSNIKCPIAILYGKRDGLLDVDKLLEKINKPVYYRCYDQYGHMDFLFGMDAHQTIFPEVIKLLKSENK